MTKICECRHNEYTHTYNLITGKRDGCEARNPKCTCKKFKEGFICIKCKKIIKLRGKHKNICRKCFEDPKTKHKGQLTQKSNKKPTEFSLSKLMQKHSHMEEGIHMIMFDRIMELNKTFIKKLKEEMILTEYQIEKLNKLSGEELI